MSKIEPWEKILKNPDNPDGPYFLRLGDTETGLDVYEHGYVVGTLTKYKDGYKLKSCSYPSDLRILRKVIQRRAVRLDGTVVAGIDEAIRDTIRAAKAIEELAQRIEDAFDAE